MREWGMETAGIQLHTSRPTGRVTARFEGGEPVYEIEANQAYDDVTRKGLPPDQELREGHLLYHGSLALREAGSMATCEHLRRATELPTLVDVNLRTPWWNRSGVLRLMEGADWVKLNREEAALLSGIGVEKAEEMVEPAEALRESLGIGTLVVTLGAEGAIALSPRGPQWQAAPTVTDGIDPVGAGDAFSAILALGVRGDWPVEVTLARAVAFAADLCRIRGATTDDRDLYSRHLRRWDHAE
jgi:fructokinase